MVSCSLKTNSGNQTFFRGKVCYKLPSLLVVNAEKWGAKPEKWVTANLLQLNFSVLLGLPSQLSVFLKLCITNTLLHF